MRIRKKQSPFALYVLPDETMRIQTIFYRAVLVDVAIDDAMRVCLFSQEQRLYGVYGARYIIV